MARISSSVKAMYKREGLEEGPCFYCGGPGTMDDLTPNPKAHVADLEAFGDDFMKVRACKKCWAKIYTANIAYAGAQFNAPMGCMSLDQKTELIGVKVERKLQTRARFMLAFEREYVTPSDAVRADGIFITRGVSLFEAEISELQGAFAARLLGLPERHVERALQHVVGDGGILDPGKEDIYRMVLDLEKSDVLPD